MPRLPEASNYVIIGAGIHGLSTAMHLAQRLEARGGDGARIVVVDKTGIGAGASGIACGVVRNNYFQPAMSELMQACVEVWESDPEAYHYNAVGYIALGADVQEADLRAGLAFAQQREQDGGIGAVDPAVDLRQRALGRFVESLFGGRRFLLLLWAGVLGGSLASFATNPHPSVGISGGLFGLVGAMLALGLRHRRRLTPPVKRMLVRAPLEVIVLNLALGLALPIIDNSAHLGGLVTGFALAFLLPPRPEVEAAKPGSAPHRDR